MFSPGKPKSQIDNSKFQIETEKPTLSNFEQEDYPTQRSTVNQSNFTIHTCELQQQYISKLGNEDIAEEFQQEKQAKIVSGIIQEVVLHQVEELDKPHDPRRLKQTVTSLKRNNRAFTSRVETLEEDGLREDGHTQPYEGRQSLVNLETGLRLCNAQVEKKDSQIAEGEGDYKHDLRQCPPIGELNQNTIREEDAIGLEIQEEVLVFESSFHIETFPENDLFLNDDGREVEDIDDDSLADMETNEEAEAEEMSQNDLFAQNIAVNRRRTLPLVDLGLNNLSTEDDIYLLEPLNTYLLYNQIGAFREFEFDNNQGDCIEHSDHIDTKADLNDDILSSGSELDSPLLSNSN